MTFRVTSGAIDLDALRRSLHDESCGACVFFEGWVRNHNEGRAVERLEYEVYEPLAVKEGDVIIGEALEKFGFTRALCVHRSGALELGDIAVVVGVTSPHRDEAFRAARYIIDEMKQRLPIWKKEHYTGGEAHWVNCRRCAHPQREDAA